MQGDALESLRIHGAPLIREQGVGSSNLPAPTNKIKDLEKSAERELAFMLAFSAGGPLQFNNVRYPSDMLRGLLRTRPVILGHERTHAPQHRAAISGAPS